MLNAGKTNTIAFTSNSKDWICNSISVQHMLTVPSTHVLAGMLGKTTTILCSYWPWLIFLVLLGWAIKLYREEYGTVEQEYAGR